MVCVIALVTRVLSIRLVWLAINPVGLLRSSTNNKISVLAGASLVVVFFFVVFFC